MSKRVTSVAGLLLLGIWAGAATPFTQHQHPAGIDIGTSLNEIADQGFNHSEIPTTAEYLDDQIGGRMTNSPAMRKAERWTQEKFRGWGLKNVHTEGFEFGRGWWIEADHIRMISPRPLPLLRTP